MGDVAEGLHVVHDGGLAPEAARLREGGPGAGSSTLAFQRVQQTRLLTAHIPPSADMEMKVQAITGSQDILAQIAGGVSLSDRLRQAFSRQSILPAQENVGHLRLDGIGADE